METNLFLFLNLKSANRTLSRTTILQRSNKPTYCLMAETLKLLCVYALVNSRLFSHHVVSWGKHLLSYYHNDANVADVWGNIYMTIYCQALKDFMASQSPSFPPGRWCHFPNVSNYTWSLGPAFSAPWRARRQSCPVSVALCKKQLHWKSSYTLTTINVSNITNYNSIISCVQWLVIYFV